MSDAPVTPTLFRETADRTRAVRIVPLSSPTSRGAVAIVAALGCALAVGVFLLILAQRNLTLMSERVEVYARLSGTRLESTIGAAEPLFYQLAFVAAGVLAVDDPPETARRYGGDRFAALLAGSPAAAAAAVDPDGEVVFQAGRYDVRTLVSDAFLREIRREAPKGDSPVQFHEPVAAGSQYLVPVSLDIGNPALGTRLAFAEGEVIVFVSAAALGLDLQAGLPVAGGMIALLTDGDRRILAIGASAEGDRDVFAVGRILDGLPPPSPGAVDGEVRLFQARSIQGETLGWGREWVGAIAPLPVQPLSVVILSPSGGLALALRDGIWLIVAGTLPGIVGVVLLAFALVNEWRKQGRSAEQLETWVARYRIATSLADSGLIEWHPQAGTVVLSGLWKKLIGYRADAIADEIDQWHGRIHPDDRQRALETLQAVMDGQSTLFEQRYRLEMEGGVYGEILERGAAELDSNGRPIRVVIVHRRLDDVWAFDTPNDLFRKDRTPPTEYRASPRDGTA